MLNKKRRMNGKMIFALSLILFALYLPLNAFAAQDFIIENRTAALLVVNGTTGNIIMAPSFGMVGIGTVLPYNTLTVVGSVGISGSLNASSINVTGNSYFATSSGNVGIGTTAPQNKLEVIGSTTLAGGVNASSLNVTGFSITDDSLVTVVTDVVVYETDYLKENKEIKGSQNQVFEPKVRSHLEDDNDILLFKSFGLDRHVSEFATSSLAFDWKTVGWQNQVLRSPVKRVGSHLSGFKTQRELRVPALPSIIPINEFVESCPSLDCDVADYITSKKKIKDIKTGDYALSLDESTGKLVPRKVSALLDHGIKPIYEMATEDGRAINTTAEHPYFVKLYDKELCDKYAGNVWNKEADEFNGFCNRWVEVKNLSEGQEIFVPYLNGKEPGYLSHIPKEIDLDSNLGSSVEHFSVIGDKQRIIDFGAGYENIIESAKLGSGGNIHTFAENISFVNYSSDSFNKISCINSYLFNSSKPGSDRCDLNNSNIRDNKLCFAAIYFVHNRGSNAVKPELLLKNFVLFFAPRFKHSLYDYTAINSLPHQSYFLSRIFLISLVGSMSDLTLLLNDSLISSNDIAVLLGSNSSIIECSSLSTFLNFSAINSAFIDITAKTYGQGIYKDFGINEVYPVKISSIRQLEPQHVYDLSIEGTRNFIANDIVAHNTYLATSSGNVGIGTTSPQNKLEVIGSTTLAGGVNASSLNVTGFSITDDSLVTVVEFDEEENKKSLNQAETIQPEVDMYSNKYINHCDEIDFSVVERARSLTDKAPVRLTGRCGFENGSEISPRSHLYDSEIEKKENQTHSLDKNPVRLTGISHEFFLDSKIAESHTLSSNKQSNYKNFSVKKLKIKDIKAGQYALSLNEATGKLEPAKVSALLDHGIKPIYEMATEDGRAINTTAEHPYFVKLSLLGIGDDLNLPSSSSSIKNPSKSSTLDLSLSKIEKDSNKDLGLSCEILNQTTENILSLGNFDELVKCLSLVTNTRCSDLENAANIPFESLFGLNSASILAV